MTQKSIAIIGGGASALMFASQINTKLYDVTIYEKNLTLGRKFLVAGDGGLNLTHSEHSNDFLSRYTPASFIKPYFQAFNNTDLNNWFWDMGIETYVGSSKRVFPLKETKPIEVLNAILALVKKNEVKIETLHNWLGWTEKNELLFNHQNIELTLKPDFTVFALGGASWKITGSDGTWLPLFAQKEIRTIPYQASNCAFEITWPAEFIEACEGQYLKNIAINCGSLSKKGELTITKLGLEGGAIYALSNKIRTQLKDKNEAIVYVDLKPTLHLGAIEKILSNHSKSVSEILKFDLNVNATQVALLKAILSKEDFLSAEILAENIKKLPIKIIGTAPIDEAISTVGGIALSEVNTNLELNKMPNNFCMGEMLDWDAPTGGYLLQANFSMGNYLAEYFNGL